MIVELDENKHYLFEGVIGVDDVTFTAPFTPLFYEHSKKHGGKLAETVGNVLKWKKGPGGIRFIGCVNKVLFPGLIGKIEKGVYALSHGCIGSLCTEISFTRTPDIPTSIITRKNLKSWETW